MRGAESDRSQALISINPHLMIPRSPVSACLGQGKRWKSCMVPPVPAPGLAENPQRIRQTGPALPGPTDALLFELDTATCQHPSKSHGANDLIGF